MKATIPITLPYFQRSRGWILLLLLLILPASLKAELLYSTSGNTITITGSNPKATGDLVIPATINNLAVRSIGSAAFSGCSGLTSVTIPSSVTSIAYAAFAGCSGLTSVTIPDGVTSIGNEAFQSCSKLTSVTIPGGVTTIGNGAFSYCGLTSVTIPNSITTIGNQAFYYCSGLTSVTIPGGVTTIGVQAFSYCSGLTSITIPNSVMSIGSYAFLGCSGLTSLTIPNSVTSIGDQAFQSCSGLTSVTIPNSITTIGTQAFYGCSGLTSVTIPNSVTSIGSQAFYGCSGLTSVTIPNSVTSIGYGAFSGCSGLTRAFFRGGAPSMGGAEFYGTAQNFAVYYIPGKAGWTTFSSSPKAMLAIAGSSLLVYTSTGGKIRITGINPEAVDTLFIPPTVDNLPVTSIGTSAFEIYPGLTNVTIPSSVTSIASFAFYGSSRLTSVYFLGDAPSIGSEVFTGATNGTIYYVQGTAGWSSYYGGLPTATWVPPLPSISVQPISLTVIVGSPATLSVSATGMEPLSYQWSKEGVTIVGGTNAIFSITATTESDAGRYRVAVSNSGGTVASEPAQLTVNLPPVAPSITVQPLPVTVITGSPVSFTVTTTGTAPLLYQWARDSVNIAKATNQVFSLAAATTADAGLYRVTVSNGGGTVISQTALLTVNLPPVAPSITIQPLPVTVIIGSPVSFTVTTTGTAPLLYQWARDSVNIAKATNQVFSLAAATTADAGLYRVTVSNSAGITASEAVQLTVNLPILLYSTIENSITITGSNPQAAGDLVIPATINNLPVRSIAANAFINSGRLTSVTIPSSVTSIGNSAFQGCTGLTSITIPKSVTSIGSSAFQGCSGLTSVTIPNSVTSIGNGAFQGCSGLTSVTIPNSVTSIGDQAFLYCSGLTSVTIPNSVTSIGDNAFFYCSGLTSVTIPNSVRSIGNSAFRQCSGLSSVTIPNSVTYIGPGAFMECSGLTSVTIPNSVTSIGDQAFSGCSRLTSVTIPDSVTYIGYQSFKGCSGLTRAFFRGSAPGMGSAVFDGTAQNFAVYYIPGKAGWNSFSSSPKARLAIAGSSLLVYTSTGGKIAITGINPEAVDTLFIPPTVDNLPVTSIGTSAFEIYPGLTNVTIPSSVTSIASFAFYGSSRLTSVYFLGDAPSIGSEVFTGATNGTIYYVQGTAGWSSYYGGLPTATWVPPPPIAPSISVQPTPVTVIAGYPTTLSVTATGTEPFSYQWSKQGVILVGGTNSIFSITATTEADAGLYLVRVSNIAGTVASEPAQLTVNLPTIAPSITVQPLPVTVTAGSPVSFTVTSTGTAPLSYQWAKDSVNIAKATNEVFSLAAATATDAGLYRVTVSNGGGAVVSQTARLTVTTPLVAPTITVQPLPFTVVSGSPAYFTVAVSGTGPLTYQWRKDSVNIAKATNYVFSLATTTGADAGLYQVTISNSGGAVVSQTARLTVSVPPIAPTIDVHPLPVTVTVGSPAYFAVVVTGTAPLFYQWSKDGLTLPEAAYPIFSLAKATTADAGLYRVTVSNSAGTVASVAARLTVNIAGLPADNTLVLELSTDLGNPLWTPIATNYVRGSGLQRFYRLVPR